VYRWFICFNGNEYFRGCICEYRYGGIEVFDIERGRGDKA
jgi:hypothetical protein